MTPERAGGLEALQRVLCVCLHPREAHADEMPYECCDMLHNGELCECRGFELPRRQAKTDEGPIQENYNDSIEDVDEFNRKTGGGVW